MRFLRPKSLLQLTLLGFTLTSLPLLVALVSSLIYMQRLADQSQRAVYQAVQITKNSQMLGEQTRNMERAARQYAILADPVFLETYQSLHLSFHQTANTLKQLPMDSGQRGTLQQLLQNEEGITRIVRHVPGEMDANAQLLPGFDTLGALSQTLLNEGNRMIDREVARMRYSAQSVQELLLALGFSLIPATLVFITFFTVLITRPIRQIDHSIRLLGARQMGQPISISGPQDLQMLGGRLEWLRCRLLDLEEQKNKFLRHVSHELKTPLTAIREGTDLLSEQVLGPLNAEQREVTTIVRQNSLSLQRLIENLLNFNAAQARNSALDIQLVEVGKIVREVAGQYRLSAKAKALDMELILPPLVIPADPEKVRTIVDNLISNAVKYCPPSGAIRIALSRHDAYAVMDVIDTGPGIDAADSDRVFDMFYQGRHHAMGPVQGTGIGLSIVKELVQAHGGQVEIADSGSQGAHFRVLLPITQGD